MKQLISMFVAAIAITTSASALAQDGLTGISSADLEQLQQLACTGSTSNSEMQTALGDLESTLTQALAAYGIEYTEEQLQSAYDQAAVALSQLETNNSVQQFCSGS